MPLNELQRPAEGLRSRHHTGKLAEIDTNPSCHPSTPATGRTYVFKSGAQVWSDHEAVLGCPGAFIEAID